MRPRPAKSAAQPYRHAARGERYDPNGYTAGINRTWLRNYR